MRTSITNTPDPLRARVIGMLSKQSRKYMKLATAPGEAGRLADERFAAAPLLSRHGCRATLSDTSPSSVEPPECRSGEVLTGLLRPDQCEAFGTRCNARASARCTDGVERRSLCRVLKYGRSPGQRASATNMRSG